MRRVLLVLLAAVPALALAQSTPSAGGISFTSNTINAAQCKGARTADPPVGESQQVRMTWVIKPNTTFSSPGTYKLYAANQQVQAEQWGGTSGSTTSCTTQQTSATGFVVNLVQVGGNDTVSADSDTRTVSVDTVDLATAAGYAPACTGNVQTVHVCVEWTPSGGSASGWATATLSLDPTIPAAPSNPTAAPGDGTIHITGCTAGSGDTRYIAKASAGGRDFYSSSASSCGDLRISGLTNGTVYTVVVFGINDAGNPSVASNAVSDTTTTTPIPTNDYWEQCKDDHCPEQGGCATGGLAAGLFGALSSLIAFRRRKS